MADELVQQLPGLLVLQHREVEGSDVGVAVVLAGTKILLKEFVGVTIDWLYNGDEGDAIEIAHEGEGVTLHLP